MELNITIRLEPVRVESVGDAGYCKHFHLDQQIVCTELIPAIESARQYHISLSKAVESSRDALAAEQELVGVLEDLAKIWHVLTGHRLGHLDLRVMRIPRYESNLVQVEQALLEKENRATVCKSLKMS